ncbi:phosphate translocator, putative [Plasmodium berghei]|uniref:Phosphate translocator, putative n=2 Tax=Plasmodium berghei TaxID=5821 RepID=A0A509AUN2_PLABA|nr:phosphate translocator, putative [Plasmodium berghei ANKA]CXJ20796.1 phosphate translocator, putative [Plasmodium berghei]SCM26559.1 phosphate translocator, putative [Plasmodium berghei]SCN28519.1 phosphate translocator, putative [Plasmodium berghei]SCO62709.1 phosphate translocator, putative [Plasmodium berghei]SCO64270.1 phosphate translocator, putative [Plasmodium berghei]|eukprot:XP_034424165.1 phosphate translocator, putative [Plasmodium berghei ANKA]
MKTVLKYAKKKNSDQNEITNEDDQTTVNCISISDININDIEENVITRDNNGNKKKKDKKIEYYLFDVESYNSNNGTSLNSVIDLNSIKSHYLPENKKKNAKKKASSYIKKHVKKYKKKYKILPEHNLDQDTSYEESVKNEKKGYDTYELKEIKNDKTNNDFLSSQKKENLSKKNNSFIDVIKFVLLISCIFSLGSFSTTITKYIFFVKKFNYTQIVSFFEFLVMFLILKTFIFFAKIKSSTSLTRKQYIRYIVFISALLGLSAISGNSAYSYLEIPVISVIKSSSLVLIYFLSIKFGLKEFKCSLLVSILTILMGVIMSITTLKIDSLFGVFLLIIYVISSSFKWVFTDILLKSTSMKAHIILLHIYQISMLIIIIPTLIIDMPCIINDYNNNNLTIGQILSSLGFVSLGAVMSIFLILAEFSLISHTSSVTLSIIFIGREAIILIIGSLFFGENIDLRSSIGIAISMIGTILYGYASK